MNQVEVDFNRMRFFIRPYETHNLSFPAKKRREIQPEYTWIPACAGMTGGRGSKIPPFFGGG